MTLSWGEELKELLVAAPALSLSVAESLTCGGVQERLGRISGASTFFHGGITAYSLEQKVRHLQVDRASAESCEAVSAEVARQMAQGACRLFSTDLAVATTGYAEAPPRAVADAPFAWWALAHRVSPTRWVERHGRIVCPGRIGRTEVQAIVADAVLAELLGYVRTLRRVR